MKRSDRVARPALALDQRKVRTPGRYIRPVRLPIRALLDPAADEIDLGVSQAEPGSGRRHATGFVRRADPLIERAPGAVAGNDDAQAALFGVDSQPHLPLLFVGSVAGEALVAKRGPDFAVEIDFRH